MEQDFHARRDHEVVRGDLVRSRVVCLCDGLAEQVVRLIQAAEPGDARQQVVCHAVHDLPDLSVHVRMQAAEVGDARGRAHAAEEAVALDQQSGAPRARGRHGGGDAGGAAAEHDHLVFAQHRCLPAGFGQGRLHEAFN